MKALTTVLPPDWDDWMLAAGSDASLLQTSHWARLRKEANAAVPIPVEIKEGGRRRAAALLIHRKASAQSPFERLRDIVAGFRNGWLECHFGPVLTGTNKLADLNELLTAIDALLRETGIKRVHFYGRPLDAAWPLNTDIAEVFYAHGYVANPWLTALVDLTKSEDELLASFHQSVRKAIRKCREAGIEVRSCADAAEFFRDFGEPYLQTRRALGVGVDQGHDLSPWWNLGPSGFGHFFVARDPNGTVLGTLGTYRWNGLATEIMSERTLIARERRLPVQDILHWEAFRTHRALGDRLFNLAGFSPAPANEKEAGIRHFKEKWHGETVSIPTFERFDRPLVLKIVQFIKRKIRTASAASN